ncbi:enoyl-CoA hydratase [Amaricoccus solimangrovi]|uniref:Enoyl-CoA hydratase n=1 Tax=Amaricoccus solimangrovi TaxID=2589815 RepID=A0A501WXN5_9RHOB|nr:enoyl-CoA hydratase [Amaricoccus solimangrovi]TPE53482.1 enoyl-CoA hydratase [Amaricoccus solimangrovi]
MAEGDFNEGDIGLVVADQVARVTFDRPAARNAMTFQMYERLGEICATLEARADLRAVVFRGAGGAFVAGTDISEFTAFRTGADGVAYEERINAAIARIEALPAPTLAVVDGAAVGGGLVIAAACDLRIATPKARFGVPIARTVGNCLSAANVARLVRAFGEGPAKTMLLLSRMIDGEAAHRLGFALACVPPEELEAEADRIVGTLREAAPLTLAASRETFRRLAAAAPPDAETVARVYGSADFREGVAAFLHKRRPVWRGA